MALPHDVQNVTLVLIVSRVIAYVAMEFAGNLILFWGHQIVQPAIYKDESESDDDTVKEIRGKVDSMAKQVADERDDRSISTDMSLKSQLMTTPLLKKNQRNTE